MSASRTLEVLVNSLLRGQAPAVLRWVPFIAGADAVPPQDGRCRSGLLVYSVARGRLPRSRCPALRAGIRWIGWPLGGPGRSQGNFSAPHRIDLLPIGPVATDQGGAGESPGAVTHGGPH